jgi:peptidoglycan/xylan/chitin deacetylase (PgdA/CDA1 family)
MYHGTTTETAAAFRAQVAFLAKTFRIVSLEQMVDRIARKAGPAANDIVLTFDDGLRNNLTNVYPVLAELRASATFFLCPGLLGSGKWLWNHEARCRLEMLSDDRWTILVRRLSIQCNSVETVVEWMKSLRPNERNDAEEIIRSATPEFAASVPQKQAYDIMDWNDLSSLDPKLITIGSHTMTHAILTRLDAVQLECEVAESRCALEQRLNRPVDYFCYPNGAHDSRVREAVRKTYRAAVTTESGLVTFSNGDDPHSLPRISGAESPALLAWRLHRPGA